MAPVVLMLAHDGVSQPAVWERWEATGDVRVCVHCPENLCCDFSQKRRLPIEFGETRWGEVSVVREMLKALESVLAFDDRELFIFTVSGTCVPVCPASQFAKFRTSTFGLAEDVGRGRMQCSQWMGLTREDAEKVVCAYWDPAEIERAALDTVRDGVPLCADNSFFARILKPYPLDTRVTREVALDRELITASGFDRFWKSPIEWTDMDSTLTSRAASDALTDAPTYAGSHAWSLRAYLICCRLQRDCLFARKVMPSVRFTDDILQLLFSQTTSMDLRRAAFEVRKRDSATADVTAQHVQNSVEKLMGRDAAFGHAFVWGERVARHVETPEGLAQWRDLGYDRFRLLQQIS